MERAVSGDIARTTCASSVRVERLVHGVQNDGVPSHAEVIVRAPNGHLVLLVGRVGDGELFGESVDVVEVPVRLVLVLLVERGLVVLLVIELTWRWRSTTSNVVLLEAERASRARP